MLCTAALVVHRRLKPRTRKDSSGSGGDGRPWMEERSVHTMGATQPTLGEGSKSEKRVNLGRIGSSVGLALVSGVDEKHDKDEFFGASQMRPGGGMQLHREASRGTGLKSEFL